MPEKTLEGMRVAILATDAVEDAELKEPRKALEQAGAQTTLFAPKAGQIYSFNHHDKAATYKVEKTLEEANASQFDAVLLPGGALNADTLRVQPRAQQFVREIDQAGKPVAVICHAPWLLISADLVRGRTITSYHTIQDDVRNAGAKWQDEEVVRDKNWVSSRQPSDIPAFNQAMIELFAESRRAAAERTRRVA
ncbi:MAG TPA: type 1 glutamine amidotransferase domain-containing protein [Candidatus Sulfotelmatobacter sp.]|nr:type 1 glutamine amidotransferase domain-containing protein [Candidatus Sulfotelmatobacter sp.]